MRIYICGLVSLLILYGCATKKNTPVNEHKNVAISVLTEELFDSSRNRRIPVAYYNRNNDKPIANLQKLVIFSHGYGQNRGGDNLAYSYLCEYLAEQEYYVVSIQHELPNDELLAMDGNLRETRMPNWQRGMENIHFVLAELKKASKKVDFDQVALIGHSNGGDMSVLFAHKYPELIHKVISLDNRRMPLPRVANPKVYTIRSNDFPADEGVLPSALEADKFGMIVKFTDINHSSMDDDGTAVEKKVIIDLVRQYLSE